MAEHAFAMDMRMLLDIFYRSISTHVEIFIYTGMCIYIGIYYILALIRHGLDNVQLVCEANQGSFDLLADRGVLMLCPAQVYSDSAHSKRVNAPVAH